MDPWVIFNVSLILRVQLTGQTPEFMRRAKLVYAKENPDGGAGIWVVDAGGESQPLRITEGTLTFWPWK